MVNNLPISRTDKHKCLGVQVDEKLSWDSLIDMVCKKASAGIGVMRRTKPFVPIDTLEKAYKSLVQPYFEYCSHSVRQLRKTTKRQVTKISISCC